MDGAELSYEKTEGSRHLAHTHCMNYTPSTKSMV